MSPDEYQKFAGRTMNKDLSKENKMSMLCMGLAGETGEIIDHVKKHIYHGHDLDKGKIKKELGDVLWYVANACSEFELSLENVMFDNIEKLKSRYPEGFSPERSRNREEYQAPDSAA